MQAVPSLQEVPSGLTGFVQTPLEGSHAPVKWHWSRGAQVTVVIGAPQDPAMQRSPVVQAVPSLQGAPSGLAGFEQTPVAASQAPGRWHWSGALQETVVSGLPQVPLVQVSPVVQALPSSQAVCGGLFL